MHKHLYEIIFHSGTLLPEEFLNDILTMICKHSIKWLVLTDVKYIGISFPFLMDSGTSGNLLSPLLSILCAIFVLTLL